MGQDATPGERGAFRAPSLRPLSPAERETFFAAIARHRRAVWRVSLASGACSATLAVVAAVLLAPLFFALIVLAADCVNFARPMPDLFKAGMDGVEPFLQTPGKMPLLAWPRLLALAALPGLAAMGLVTIGLTRLLRCSSARCEEAPGERDADPRSVAEKRFVDVVEEMAIAASIPPPRIRIAPALAFDVAIRGPDERHASIVVSEGFLGALEREKLEGVAAWLIATIVDGDMTLRLRVARTMCLFGVSARLSGALSEPAARTLPFRLLRGLLRPNAEAARRLEAELLDPFGGDEAASAPRTPAPRTGEGSTRLGRSDWAWMPLSGPLVMTGFFTGIIANFVLSPLLALVLRQRTYMADAASVRLTRDPDALAGALRDLSAAGRGVAFRATVGQLSIDGGCRSGARGLLGASVVPTFPSVERRLRALVRLGATAAVAPPRWSWRLALILGPIAALLAGLLGFAVFLMAVLSLALSGLMLLLPVSIIHLLLRTIAP